MRRPPRRWDGLSKVFFKSAQQVRVDGRASSLLRQRASFGPGGGERATVRSFRPGQGRRECRRRPHGQPANATWTGPEQDGSNTSPEALCGGPLLGSRMVRDGCRRNHEAFEFGSEALEVGGRRGIERDVGGREDHMRQSAVGVGHFRRRQSHFDVIVADENLAREKRRGRACREVFDLAGDSGRRDRDRNGRVEDDVGTTGDRAGRGG